MTAPAVRADIPKGYTRVAAGGVDAATLLSALISGGIPAGTTSVRITPAAQAIRWRDDGTAPTTAIGYPLAVGVELVYSGAGLGSLQIIAQVAGAVLDIVCYA